MECRNCEHLRNCKRQCMDLPEGKTCGDCCYIAHCQLFYGVKGHWVQTRVEMAEGFFLVGTPYRNCLENIPVRF